MTARHDVLAPVVLGMVMSVLAVCVGGDAQGATPGPSVIAGAGDSVAAPTPLGEPAIPGTSDIAAGALAAPAWVRAPTTRSEQFVGGGGEATTGWSSHGAPRTATLLALVRENGSPNRFVRPPDRPYRAFSLAATGDLLIHTPVRTRAATSDGGHDFAPQLAAAYADIAAADLGLCHLEVPLDPVGPYSSYPIFNAPAELADGIAATGWDVCSTASNHSADKGFEGLVRTLDALDAAGVEHRGMFRTEDDWLEPRLHRVQDVQLGLLSATYGLNGLPAPGGHEWSVQRIDVPVLLQQAVALREAGAEVVVISLHWGNEYQHAPSAYQRSVAAQLMAGPEVDAIIGHHAHVVQPVEWIADRPVVYGLGNFLSGQRPTERRDGAIVTLEFRERAGGWSVEAVHAQPTWVDDSYSVVIAEPDAGGVLGASAQRTLGYLGVPLSPPPGPPRVPPEHYQR